MIADRAHEIQQSQEDIVNLHFATSSKGLFDGLPNQIDEFMKEHHNARLITIDTLEHIRRADQETMPRHDRGLYSTDYSDMQVLRSITDKHKSFTMPVKAIAFDGKIDGGLLAILPKVHTIKRMELIHGL